MSVAQLTIDIGSVESFEILFKVHMPLLSSLCVCHGLSSSSSLSQTNYISVFFEITGPNLIPRKFLFFAQIGNPKWTPTTQVIVLTLDHMRKIFWCN